MFPVINKEYCTGCGACIEICPTLALELKDKKVQFKEELCEECGLCAAECPVEAIRIVFPLYSD